MEILFAPWRYEYVSTSDGADGCVFCKIISSKEDGNNFVLFRARHNIVVLNRYPYTSGHLMVAPTQHLSDPTDAEQPVIVEMTSLSLDAVKIVKQVFKPHGINLGMNIGRVAGAGVEGHFHLHVVPRWSGDTSFVSVTGQARVISQSLEGSYEMMRPLFSSLNYSS